MTDLQGWRGTNEMKWASDYHYNLKSRNVYPSSYSSDILCMLSSDKMSAKERAIAFGHPAAGDENEEVERSVITAHG